MNNLIIGRFPSQPYATAEAINTLCTNLSFSGEEMRRIMITSSHASEGKSWLSMNIIRTMAKYGKSVVLVDADLRRSEITSRYKLQFSNPEYRWGLAHYLAGKASEEDVIYRTNIEGAYMVPVGREISNPLPLLNSKRFERLLIDLAQRFDSVFVDVPPLGMVIDGAQIAKFCDGALVTVSFNAVRRQELIDVKEQLEQTGCPILGTVLNMVEYDSYLSKKYYYKSHYYNYGYHGHESENGRPDGKRGNKSRRE